MSDRELLAEIHEKTLNRLAATVLPVPDSIHVAGLKGGLEEIRDMTVDAYDEVAE